MRITNFGIVGRINRKKIEFPTETEFFEYVEELEKNEKRYNPLLFTHCSNCGKRIIIFVPFENREQKKSSYWTCNKCVPEDSAARNDIDEPFFTDVSRYLFNDEDE